MKNILKSEGGFTLVELLGVVAIIAVLATVAITSISGAIQAGRESAAKRQLQTLNSAYQNFLAAGGTTSGATALLVQADLKTAVNLAGRAIGPFLKSAPVANVTDGAGIGVVIDFSADSGFTANGY